MNAKTQGGQSNFYNTHSLYGIAEAAATFLVLKEVTGKRGYVISR